MKQRLRHWIQYRIVAMWTESVCNVWNEKRAKGNKKSEQYRWSEVETSCDWARYLYWCVRYWNVWMSVQTSQFSFGLLRFSENQMKKRSICFKEFMISCLPTFHSLSFSVPFLAFSSFHPPPTIEAYIISSASQIGHVPHAIRFHLLYFTLSTRWNMVWFRSLHVLFDGRD